MLTEDFWLAVMRFIIGEPHRIMGTAFLIVVVNMVVDMYLTKTVWKSISKGIERLFGYLAFIIIAVRIDDLFIDELFQWEGSTQFLVVLYVVGRELRKIVRYLEERFGFSIPIINDRLDQMEGGRATPGSGWQDPSRPTPVDIDDRIDRLRTELYNLERRQENRRQDSRPINDKIKNDWSDDQW